MDVPRARVRVGVRQGDSARSWSRGDDLNIPGPAGAGVGGDARKEGYDGAAEES